MNLVVFFVQVLSFCVLAESQYRLSTTVSPTRYSIKLNPNLDEETFSGEVSIYVTISASVETIQFHSCNLTINSIFLNNKKVNYYLDDKKSILVYKSAEYQLIEIGATNKSLIPPGSYIIKIRYNGFFSKPTRGLFKTGITYQNKTLSHLVATDFEPTYARTVFPCFDEPFFKARFQLSIVVPDYSYKAISNMKVHNIFKTSEGVIYKFCSTPPMSTYLVAFSINQLPFGEYIGCSKIPIRVYALNATSENSRKIMKYVDTFLTLYTKYTNYSYPLPKIDLIEYDRYGNTATENWGLITILTGLLSPDYEIYDDAQKFAVLAHELAHYWFGNLVTNQWWDDIWLQEGIATFMALKAGDILMKDNSTLDFSPGLLEEIYYHDVGGKYKPVVNYEEHPLKITDNFNDVAYVKGAAIMRMIELALGEEKFRNAIINYIRMFAFKTANTNDFLNILEKYTENKLELRSFVESYLYQNEYPIIDVVETETEYVLQQSRREQSNATESRFEYKWTIPLTYITNLNEKPCFEWFDKEMENLTIPKRNENWIKFNYKQAGMYRINYSPSLWEKFYKFSNEMDKYERDHLILEAAAMLDADRISCDIFLRYIEQLSIEKNINVNYFLTALTRLELGKRLDVETYNLLMTFLIKVFKNSGRSLIAQHLQDKFSNKSYDNSIAPNVETVRAKRCVSWLKEKLR